MNVALFSDIHANLTAFKAVLSDCISKYGTEIPIVHLGDCIDYGMRPNEVIEELQKLQSRMIVNIRGNHEEAILGRGVNRFSSQRGIDSNRFTQSLLTEDSKTFLQSMSESSHEILLANKRLLIVHGDVHDVYWGKMSESERLYRIYRNYDFVISGHTHVSLLNYVFDKKEGRKTVFINPGSIGQPRNCNVNAQYAVLNIKTGSVYFEAVPYDYLAEQTLYHGEIDVYYRDRLALGI